MATTVFDGYRTQPILLAALCDQPSTWLVALSGYQSPVWGDNPRFGQLTGLQEIFTAALGRRDNYSLALLQHLRARVPSRARLILVGHSLGGMVAQNLPAIELEFAQRWQTLRVITLGAPVMNQGRLPSLLVRRFAANDQPGAERDPGLEQVVSLDHVVVDAPDWAAKLGFPGLFAPATDRNTVWVDAAGRLPLDWIGIHRSYPDSQRLKTYDAVGNTPLATALHLDRTRMWRLPVGSPFPETPAPLDRGMPLVDDQALRKGARDRQLIIIVRDSNPYAMKWVGAPGYAPKPEWIKDKTLNRITCPGRPDLWGLAAAQPDGSRSLAQVIAEYESVNIHVGTAAECYVLAQPAPGDPDGLTRYYSDIDLHGVYARNPVTQQVTDAWSPNLLVMMNDKFLEEMVQHPPHDNWEHRNDKQLVVFGRQVTNGNYGPRPPATAYLPDGRTVHLENRWQMKEFYLWQGIPWMTIYPNPDEQ